MFLSKDISKRLYWPYRITVFGISVCLVFLAPWWVSVAFAGLVLLWFGWYEQLTIGLLLDGLYPTYDASMIGVHLFTGSYVVLAVVSWYMRRRLRSVA